MRAIVFVKSAKSKVPHLNTCSAHVYTHTDSLTLNVHISETHTYMYAKRKYTVIHTLLHEGSQVDTQYVKVIRCRKYGDDGWKSSFGVGLVHAVALVLRLMRSDDREQVITVQEFTSCFMRIHI